MDPIPSIYADDPDMLEIIEDFVQEGPSRALALQARLESGDMEGLRVLAHQLKGAGGGYGFPRITEEAEALERAVKEGADTAIVKDRCATVCDCLRAIVVSEGD